MSLVTRTKFKSELQADLDGSLQRQRLIHTEFESTAHRPGQSFPRSRRFQGTYIPHFYTYTFGKQNCAKYLLCWINLWLHLTENSNAPARIVASSSCLAAPRRLRYLRVQLWPLLTAARFRCTDQRTHTFLSAPHPRWECLNHPYRR